MTLVVVAESRRFVEVMLGMNVGRRSRREVGMHGCLLVVMMMGSVRHRHQYVFVVHETKKDEERY